MHRRAFASRLSAPIRRCHIVVVVVQVTRHHGVVIKAGRWQTPAAALRMLCQAPGRNVGHILLLLRVLQMN